MKKLVVMIVGVLLAASVANAFDKIYDFTLEEFENLQISEGGVNLNNFSLAENNAFMAKGTAKVELDEMRGSAYNLDSYLEKPRTAFQVRSN